MSIMTAKKYDRIADGFAERSWANLAFDMQHRFHLATTWGTPLHAGDAILELGCGDGYLAELFVTQGFNYHGLDISPRMVAMAERRIGASGRCARFSVADADQFCLDQPVDSLVAHMGAFFTFVAHPLPLLRRLRPQIRKKIIVDLNPRGKTSLRQGVEILKQAGFVNVAWRPFFVPMTVGLPAGVLRMLGVCEMVPGLRALPLGWRFDVLLKGEVGAEV